MHPDGRLRTKAGAVVRERFLAGAIQEFTHGNDLWDNGWRRAAGRGTAPGGFTGEGESTGLKDR
jgi:hypothetical protein